MKEQINYLIFSILTFVGFTLMFPEMVNVTKTIYFAFIIWTFILIINLIRIIMKNKKHLSYFNYLIGFQNISHMK